MGHQFFCLKDVLTKFKIMVIKLDYDIMNGELETNC
jgi:hypothetical protein